MRNALTLAILSLALVALDVSAQDIKTWLDRMNQAVEDLNYEGTFVRVLDGSAEMLHIVHRNEAGEIGEKISSLDGTGREIVRRGREVQCVLPDRGVVLLEEPSGSSNPLASSLPNYSETLESHYEFVTFEKGQVARRDTQIVVIKPRDEYRYGYKLWLDRETAMPLKAQVRDENNNVVEQIMFTEFDVADSIPDAALASVIDTQGYTWIRPQEQQGPGSGAMTWHAAEVPSGFELSLVKRSVIAGADGPVDHLIYSDGLATVSVFVANQGIDVAEGFSRLGSTNAYSLTRRGHKITAMGEVPRMTVQRIATSLDSKQSEPDPE